LGERKCFVFGEIKEDAENGEEEAFIPIKINGAACRTPDEDIKWEEEEAQREAAAPKGGKAPAKGKKK